MSRADVLLGLGLAGLLTLGLASGPIAAEAAEHEFANSGAKTCLDCHGNPRVMGITETVHAKRDNPDTPAAQKACESCHGPSKVHTQFPMQIENLHFGKKSKAKPQVQNQACLECHNKKNQSDWQGSAHGFEHVVCSTCHSIHDPARIVPDEASVATGCTAAGCHPTFQPSAIGVDFTHAVGRKIGQDGEVTCTGCHNPHGPLSSERCIDCHPRTPEVVAKESEKARRFHATADERGTECIRCHKALSHPIKPLEEALEAEARKTEARKANRPSPAGSGSGN